MDDKQFHMAIHVLIAELKDRADAAPEHNDRYRKAARMLDDAAVLAGENGHDRNPSLYEGE